MVVVGKMWAEIGIYKYWILHPIIENYRFLSQCLNTGNPAQWDSPLLHMGTQFRESKRLVGSGFATRLDLTPPDEATRTNERKKRFTD